MSDETIGIGHNQIGTALAIVEPHASTLPPAPAGWQKARLPELYVRAREALKECLRVDECLEWKRKAEAFASYYRQAQDKTPHNIALRIRLRAWRRCGELFLEMDQFDGDAIDRKHTSTAEAKLIGMSPADRLKAVALAAMPEQEFEDHIAQEPPPALSKMIPVTAYPVYGTSPEQRAAASVIHALMRIYNVSQRFKPDLIAAQITDVKDGAPMLVSLTSDWLRAFEVAHDASKPHTPWRPEQDRR